MTGAAHPYRTSPQRLDRYDSEFTRRDNIRDKHMKAQSRLLVDAMTFKPPRYADLIPDNGSHNGAPSS